MLFCDQNLGFSKKSQTFLELGKISRSDVDAYGKVLFPINAFLANLDGGKYPGSNRVS